MLSFITKSIRGLGLSLIILFSLFCILTINFVHDLGHIPYLGTALEYAKSIEDRFYDFRMRKHIGNDYKSKDIVFVEINDESIQEIGSWPIPRDRYALFLNKLKTFGAKVVSFDVLFPEPSLSCSGEVSQDEIFASAVSDFQSIEGNKVFVSYGVYPNEDKSEQEIPDILLDSIIDSKNEGSSQLKYNTIHSFPHEFLTKVGVNAAAIAMSEDPDGIFRHYQYLINLSDIYLPSLGLATFSAYRPNEEVKLVVLKDGQAELKINNQVISLNHRGESKIRYRGGMDEFPVESLINVINSSEDDEKYQRLFKDKIVFLGSTATGAHDLRPSPIDLKMPGILFHINATQALIEKYLFKSQNESTKYTLIIFSVGVIILLLLQILSFGFLDFLATIIFCFGIYYLDSLYFLPEGYELRLMYTFVALIGIYAWNTFINLWQVLQEKKQIKGAFSRYVAPTIVEEMLKHPENLKSGGDKKTITCLFSDVRDFTSISEKLTAQELSTALNHYMSVMTDLIFETKGTVDKYIGDAVVAFWGAPLELRNHASLAVECAVKMMESMPQINQEFKTQGKPEYKIGIGLNSGECSVGNMGSTKIFSYTALGDNMNLGARLESLCKHYGCQILISEYTYKELDPKVFKCRPIDRVIVKGKETPVMVYEVLYAQHFMSVDKEAYDFYLKAYTHFKNREFSTALEIFNQLILSYPEDKSITRLQKLCEKFHLTPPDNLDDSFDITKMTEK